MPFINTGELLDVLNKAGTKKPQESLENILGTHTTKPKNAKKKAFPSDTLLLIDADTLAFSAAAVCDGSFWTVLDDTTATLHGDFKYKKEAILFASENGIVDPIYEQKYEPEPLANAIAILKRSLIPFEDNECRYWLTPKTNFRDTEVDDYKANRKGKRRPKHLQACKQYLRDEYGAKEYPGLEADDCVVVDYEFFTKVKKQKCIIVGVDKDLRQIEGTFSDYTGKSMFISREQGRENLWCQAASGDPTDNIKTPKGIGPATFRKAFKDVDWSTTSDYDLMKLMIKLYATKVPMLEDEDVADYVTRITMWIKRTFRLVYLLRSVNDRWEIPTREGGIRW